MDLNDVVVFERNQRTPTTDAILAYGKAAEIYSRIIYPGRTEADFFNDEEFGIETLETLGSTEDIERKILALHSVGTHESNVAASVLAIQLACIYIYRAQYEDKIGHRDLAWTFSTDARLWCATAAHRCNFSNLTKLADGCIMDTTRGLEAELSELDSRRARPKKIAATGGKARAAKLEILQKETIRRYEAEKGKWKTLPEAADEIKPDIVALSKKEAFPLAPTTSKPLEWIRDHVYPKTSKT